MSISNTTVVEIRTTGSDANGGGYDPGQAGAGTDYSQQDAAQLSRTDLACVAASTTLTSATGGFTSAMIGNYIQLTAGTNYAAGVYRITAYTDTNTVTIDRTCASGGNMSAATGAVGGALASPGQAAGLYNVSGVDYWLKTGTYSITTTTADVAGGRVFLVNGGASNTHLSHWRAYSATRGDRAAKATLQASGISSTTLFSGNAKSFVLIDGMIFDGAGLTSIRGLELGSQWRVIDCKAANCKNSGFAAAYGQSLLYGCEADTCDIGFNDTTATVNVWINCRAHDCTSHGFKLPEYGVAIHCAADDNGGDGFQAGIALVNCVAYSNSGDGYESTGAVVNWINCLAEDNGAYGFNAANSTPLAGIRNCGHYNNSSGGIRPTNFPTAELVTGNVTNSAASMVDAANADFDLNAAAGGGADLTGTGYPQACPGAASTTPKPSIGYSPPSGGGSAGVGPRVGFPVSAASTSRGV